MIYITELKDDNYTSFTEKGLALVDVWAPWCGPCKQISPIIDQLSTDYVGKVSVGKLNADDNREVVSGLGVRNIPTILLYKDGEVVEKFVGMVSKDTISSAIENNL